MKAATGELNLTVITILAIGAIVAFFWFLWPGIQNSISGGWGDVVCREGQTYNPETGQCN